MVPFIRRLVLGGEHARPWFRWPIVAVLAALLTFGAYAVGVFHIEGGVIFIPGQAALLGMLLGVVTGYARAGLISAWLVVYGPLIGHRADHAFLGLSGRTVTEQAAYFLQLEGLVINAMMAAVLAVGTYAIGWLLHLAVRVLSSDVPLRDQFG